MGVGLHSELTFATNICDVPKVAETMVTRTDREIVTSAVRAHKTDSGRSGFEHAIIVGRTSLDTSTAKRGRWIRKDDP